MKRYRYNIANLDCANCAQKIEVELNKNEKLGNVIVNFATSTISYETDEMSLDEINSLIKKIEPEASVISAKDKNKNEYRFLNLLLGLVFVLLGVYLDLRWHFNLILVIIGYGFLLYSPFVSAIKNLFENRNINENALIVISCIGALIIGETLEGMMVIVLYLIGKILEEKAVNNTRKATSDLLELKQVYANKKDGNQIKEVSVEEINVGDILIIKKGEKVPVDGIILKGNAELDMSALTGESAKVYLQEKMQILSGTINTGEVFEIEAMKKYEDSAVARILEMMMEASDKKAKTETIVSKFSKIYTPLILVLALIIAIILPMFGVDIKDSIYRGLTFLVISCPCAIAISVPLSYFAGLGVASKKGILIKGSNFLDNLKNVSKIIFDKTGTLTSGDFEVMELKIVDESYTRDEIIEIVVKGESLSNHPLAKSLLKLADKKYDSYLVQDFKEESGKGISFSLNNKKVKIGSAKFCKQINTGNLYVVINDKLVAEIMLSDSIKKEAKLVIKALQKNNIKTYMFTGDKKESALRIQEKLELDEIRYEMLPAEKYDAFEKIKSTDSKCIIFVGDGINDAPTLKRADIGISMGSLGSSAAIDASDIVLIGDDLKKIPLGIEISKYTNKIIMMNLIFALGIKFLILILSVFGFASMWAAVFADTGVTLLTVLNTLRITFKYKKKD